MQDGEAELKLRERIMAIASALGANDAEYLIRITAGDAELLDECLALMNKGISITTINTWLAEKMNVTHESSQAYKTCEAVLNLSVRREHNPE
ncbi:hypothetical protein NDI52_28455 [Leptolyngbya sp. PL-A3]|uniref:hypothetical protein n=1 Tax=Leptolyngbya sp. PL-A3 TaxID=2933911 RepID=UPI003296AF92